MNVQQIEPELLDEFENALLQVKDFDVSTLKLSEDDNEVLDVFFKKYLDPQENFPSGNRHNTIAKNFAIYIIQKKIKSDSEEFQKIRSALISKGFGISSLISQIKGVIGGTYGEEPSVNVGELVNWCKTNRPDLVELFKSEKYKKIENPYKKLHYVTNHLPFYHEFSSLISLYGRHYIPILKARWYQLHGGIIQRNFRLGSLFGDTRLHVAYPVVTEGGKNDLIYGVKSLIEKGIYKKEGEVFTMSEPISFHAESLIGKRVERTIDNPEFLSREVKSPKKIKSKVENRGHFNDDFLDFDECREVIISEKPDSQTAREYLSKAENPLGRNKVEKRSVDDLEDEKISYNPKCTNSYFFQPYGFIPEDAMLQGFMRRKLIPVGNINAFLNHADEKTYLDKTETLNFSEEEYQETLINHLNNMRSQTNAREFSFTNDAQDKIREYGLYLSQQGRIHSEPISNYCKLTKFTTLTNLVKMSCIIAGSYYQNVVNENHVSLAFMDLTELLQNTFDFIKLKVKGDFSYGTSWGGATWKEKECLRTLFRDKSFSKETSKMTISTFVKICEEVFGVKEDQARNRFYTMKKRKLIDSVQVGKDSSAVWLIISPKEHKEYLEGSKGVKGFNTYDLIFSSINQILGGCNPYNPSNPEVQK
jgi:hypothetical protein